MKRNEQDELLKELLTGEEVSDFRQSSLAGGLAALRRRRHFRRAAQFGSVMALASLMTLGFVYHQKKENSVREVASVKQTPAVATASPATSIAAPETKTISDEELFALFPGRSMALVGKPGEQQLVFLDGRGAQSRAQ